MRQILGSSRLKFFQEIKRKIVLGFNNRIMVWFQSPKQWIADIAFWRHQHRPDVMYSCYFHFYHCHNYNFGLRIKTSCFLFLRPSFIFFFYIFLLLKAQTFESSDWCNNQFFLSPFLYLSNFILFCGTQKDYFLDFSYLEVPLNFCQLLVHTLRI